MDHSTALQITTPDTTIYLHKLGTGPALLLLHGFPETHLMWRNIAPLLAKDFTVICPDLRGYGRSGCPPAEPDHTSYAKRTMANDMIAVMEQLGFPEFEVAGHDRGGRVAYRLALDHPERITRLAVLDIIPGIEVWERADSRFATAFWPWTLLSQPAPLPEKLISGAPAAIIDNALTSWGTPATTFPAAVRQAYIDPFRDPAHVQAICEEYRAAATLDIEHDKEDRKHNRRIACPVLALWSAGGPLDTWYGTEGGPLALWRKWADNVQGWATKGGHFFPEENPEEIAAAFRQFFAKTKKRRSP